MSNTPRTDAQEWDWNEDCKPAEDMIVPASFARELEIENKMLKFIAESWHQKAIEWSRDNARLRNDILSNAEWKEKAGE